MIWNLGFCEHFTNNITDTYYQNARRWAAHEPEQTKSLNYSLLEILHHRFGKNLLGKISNELLTTSNLTNRLCKEFFRVLQRNRFCCGNTGGSNIIEMGSPVRIKIFLAHIIKGYTCWDIFIHTLLVDCKSKMNLLILLLLTHSLVSAKFNRRAALTKYHKDTTTTTPNDLNNDQPTDDSVQEQAPVHGLLAQKITWKRIRAAAIKRRKLTTDKRRQKMLDLIGQSNADDSKYQALLQRLLIEENKRRQIKKSLRLALYSMNLI